MKLIYPQGEYFTIEEFAKLNKFSHRRSQRVLEDLSILGILIKSKPKFNKKETYWFRLNPKNEASNAKTMKAHPNPKPIWWEKGK